MGKPTGFLELKRELPPDRSPLERIQDWDEFHEQFPTKKLRDQGARCMDCGMPFCHTGKLIAGMATGCPIHNLIPEWNDLVYRGRGRTRSTGCTRRTTSRSSPAASARRPAKARACSASTSRRSPSRPSRRDHRQGLRRGLGRAPSRRRSAPARRWRSSAPAPPGWPPPPSSTAPATWSPSSSGPTASAAC